MPDGRKSKMQVYFQFLNFRVRAEWKPHAAFRCPNGTEKRYGDFTMPARRLTPEVY